MNAGTYQVNLRVPEGAAIRGFTIQVRPKSKHPGEARIVALDTKDEDWGEAFKRLLKESVFLDTLEEGTVPNLTGGFQLQYVVGRITALPVGT